MAPKSHAIDIPQDNRQMCNVTTTKKSSPDELWKGKTLDYVWKQKTDLLMYFFWNVALPGYDVISDITLCLDLHKRGHPFLATVALLPWILLPLAAVLALELFCSASNKNGGTEKIAHTVLTAIPFIQVFRYVK